MSSTRINRRYVARLINDKARHGKYYAGTNTRAVAVSIVQAEELHPVFVGKIDDILVEMLAASTAMLRHEKLIPADGVVELRESTRRTHQHDSAYIRSRRQTADRKRTLQVRWREESLAI